MGQSNFQIQNLVPGSVGVIQGRQKGRWEDGKWARVNFSDESVAFGSWKFNKGSQPVQWYTSFSMIRVS